MFVIGALTIVPASAAASILCPSATNEESDDIAEPDGADIAGVGIGEGAAVPSAPAAPNAPLAPAAPIAPAAPVAPDVPAAPSAPVAPAAPAGVGVALVPFAICKILVGSPPTAIILRRTSSSVIALPVA